MSLSGRALNSSDVYGAVNASAIGTTRSTSAPIRSAERRPRASHQSLSCANISAAYHIGVQDAQGGKKPGTHAHVKDHSGPGGRYVGAAGSVTGDAAPQRICARCRLGGWPTAAPRLEPGPWVFGPSGPKTWWAKE